MPCVKVKPSPGYASENVAPDTVRLLLRTRRGRGFGGAAGGWDVTPYQHCSGGQTVRRAVYERMPRHAHAVAVKERGPSASPAQ